jgi:hypothetical protein
VGELLVTSRLITSWSLTGRRTWQESGSSDVLSPFAAFYGRASSWQCSSVSGSRSETFLARHPRTKIRRGRFIR